MIINLIGIPSGEVLKVHYTYISIIYSEGFIQFEPKLNSWLFRDRDHDKIVEFVNSPKKW